MKGMAPSSGVYKKQIAHLGLIKLLFSLVVSELVYDLLYATSPNFPSHIDGYPPVLCNKRLPAFASFS